MAWISALIGLAGSGAGAAGASNAADAQKKSSALAALAGRRGYKKAAEAIQPYSELGKAGLLSLGELMGLKGYRTEQEMALNDYLKTKPTAPKMNVPERYQSDFTKFINAHPSGMNASQLGAAAGAPLEFGPVPIPGATAGFGSIAGGIAGDAKKDELLANLALASRAKNKYERSMNEYNTKTLPAWEEERNRLQYEANQSLANYDPQKILEATPGYQARYSQGMDALTASQAGRQLSGRAALEAQRYGQQYASSEYDKELARRSGLANTGFQAAGQLGNWAVGKGSSLGNLAIGQGQNQANMYSNYNNAIQGALGNTLSAYLTNQRDASNQALLKSIYGG